MRVKIQRWGNSLAVRIPKSLAAEPRIRQDAEVELSIVDGKLIVDPRPPGGLSLNELLDVVTPENLHGEIETGPAVGAEAW